MQKEFIPQLERWGVWIPGTVGGYFRSVQAWKGVRLVEIAETRGGFRTDSIHSSPPI
jgi:benzoate 4-monooxygenase